ncbi:hypothetical protein DRQ36_08605 [bacterium]|nr:MAG: hypothetical protein DRQ36_08605 [bacterium]
MNRFDTFALSCIVLIATSSFGEVDIDIGGDLIARWQWDSRDIYPNNKFSLERLRPKIKADFGSGFSGKLSFDLKNGSAELKDADISWKCARSFEIGIGRRRKPFGLEDIIGRWSVPGVDWTEIHERFDDAGYLDRDIGCWINGKLFQEPYQIEYDIGLFNGHSGDIRTSEKQFVGRFIYSPLEFVDFIGSYGTGLDTLGLEWRNAWNLGAILDPGNLELAGEYAEGTDIITEDKVEGYELWARYSFGKFQPYLQYESVGTDTESEPKTSIGLRFEPIDKIRLKLQGTYINIDKTGGVSHSEITLQAHARF